MAEPAQLAVLGAGSWGTALAVQLARNGHLIRLWGHLPHEVADIAGARENRQYLPGVTLPDTISPTDDLNAALDGADEVLVVVPSHAFAGLMARLAACPRPPASLSWASKGFEPDSGRLLHEVVAEHLPAASRAVLSGPTFAGEVGAGLPTAITAASIDTGHAERLAGYLHADRFRVYISDDLIGVQVGGAAKNVMAIAAGIADGLKFGANARAALITRGLAEITRLGVAVGGRHDTFMGLAGLGDLVLTCTDDQSRNRRMGLALASGLSIEDARVRIGQAVEGVGTTREVHKLATDHGVDMPISAQTYRVLYEGLDPHAAVSELLHREPTRET